MGFDDGKIVRVALHARHNDDGDSQVNTFHYDLVGFAGTDTNDPQVLADTFRDNVVPHFVPLYSNQWTIEPVVVAQEKDPQNPDLPRKEWTSGSQLVGTRTVTTEALPRANCGVATLISDHIGRRATGRLFLGGSTAEGDQSGGAWLTAAGEIWNLWLTLLQNIPRAPDLSPGVGTGEHAFWTVYSRTARAQNVGSYSFGIIGANLKTSVHWLRSRSTV